MSSGRIILWISRIKYEYGKDGSLELRLYLVGAGVEDTGEYTCTIPGVGVNPALLTLYITQGREQLTLGVTFTPGVCISAVSISVVCHGTIFGIYSWEHIWYIFMGTYLVYTHGNIFGIYWWEHIWYIFMGTYLVYIHWNIFGIYSWEHIWYIFKFMKSPLIDISVSRFHAEISQSYMTDVISKMLWNHLNYS